METSKNTIMLRCNNTKKVHAIHQTHVYKNKDLASVTTECGKSLAHKMSTHQVLNNGWDYVYDRSKPTCKTCAKILGSDMHEEEMLLEPLIPTKLYDYMVRVMDDPDDETTEWWFHCAAEDAEHAKEQAENQELFVMNVFKQEI